LWSMARLVATTGESPLLLEKRLTGQHQRRGRRSRRCGRCWARASMLAMVNSDGPVTVTGRSPCPNASLGSPCVLDALSTHPSRGARWKARRSRMGGPHTRPRLRRKVGGAAAAVPTRADSLSGTRTSGRSRDGCRGVPARPCRKGVSAGCNPGAGPEPWIRRESLSYRHALRRHGR